MPYYIGGSGGKSNIEVIDTQEIYQNDSTQGTTAKFTPLENYDKAILFMEMTGSNNETKASSTIVTTTFDGCDATLLKDYIYMQTVTGVFGHPYGEFAQVWLLRKLKAGEEVTITNKTSTKLAGGRTKYYTYGLV